MHGDLIAARQFLRGTAILAVILFGETVMA
jgi:hypothetical protein